MPRSQQQLTKFNFGEVTPRVLGRHEADQYPMFLETAENVYIERHGGIKSRDGHHHVLKAKFDNKQVRLIPFAFSDSDSYVLEFGDEYVRFFRNQGFVENIEGVRSYIGDGFTTVYHYPEPGVLEANIGVSINTVEQTVITDYTVAASDNVSNQVEDFTNAGAWDTDFDDGEGADGTPWVLGPGDIATSPVGGVATPILHQADINLPRGAHIDAELTIDSFNLSLKVTNLTSVIDVSLGTPHAAIINYTMPGDEIRILIEYEFELFETPSVNLTANWNYRQNNGAPAAGQINHTNSGLIRVNYIDDDVVDRTAEVTAMVVGDTIVVNGVTYTITVVSADVGYTDFTATPLTRQPTGVQPVDLISNIISDYDWELRRGAVVIDSGQRADFSGTEVISVTGILAETVLKDEVFAVYVAAVPKHTNSDPQVIGSSTTTKLDVTDYVNYDAKLRLKSVDAHGEVVLLPVDPVVGVVPLTLPDAVVQRPHPIGFSIECDAGLEVVISGVSAINNTPGWDITFVTAPLLSDLIVFLDKSTVPAAMQMNAEGESIRRRSLSQIAAVGDIFEIQSPFEEEELTRLYYVQANDQMWFCHFNHKPWLLTRHNAYDWRWTQPEYTGAPWEEPAYPAIEGYPRCVTIFQERLYFAATLSKPQTLWGSRAADFYDFTVPTGVDPDPILPDSPVEYTIAARTHEAIEWMSSERVLVIGTSSTEHRLAPDQFIATDRLPTVSKFSDYGGAHQVPAYVGDMTVFVHVSGVQLRSYKQREDTLIELWASDDLGWMNDHLFENSPVKQPAYALVPDALLFAVRLDGQLVTGTYDPTTARVEKREEFGWARHITDGKYESVTVIPVDFGDEAWVAVERDVNGVTETHIEYMEKGNKLDGMLEYPGEEIEEPIPPVGTVTNLEHLEGRTVQVIADGALHPDRVVSGGQITLDADTYTSVKVGEAFNAKIRIVPFEGGNPSGTAQGKLKRWINIWTNMWNSANPIINGKRPPERQPSTPMNTTQPNRTGRVKTINLGFDRDGQITIEQDLPLEFNLLSIYGDYEIGQG